MLKKKKGFTLIELLVVIAIIGILSTLAIIALGSARAKARDAKRLSDVKQMSTALEIAETTNPANDLTCVGAGLTTGCDDLDETADGVTLNWGSFIDPGTNSTVACADPSVVTCGYTVNLAATTEMDTSNYSICFYLEQASGSLAQGLHNVSSGGNITDNCAAL